MLQVHARVESHGSGRSGHRDSSGGRAGRGAGGDIERSLREGVVHGRVAARPRALGGDLHLVLEGSLGVVGSVHCWLLRGLLRRLLLVMVGHGGEGG